MQELKPKEIATLQALANGAVPKEIAFKENISLEAVKKRTARIRELLSAETTLHAVAIAFRKALIQ